MYWAIPIPMTLLALFVLVVRRRRIITGVGLQLLGGVPAGPTLQGLEYLFPGRSAPPDPDARKTPLAALDLRPEPELPAGVKRIDADEPLK